MIRRGETEIRTTQYLNDWIDGALRQEDTGTPVAYARRRMEIVATAAFRSK